MVEEYKNDISSIGSIVTDDSKSDVLKAWIRSIQKALTVEVDHGFTNIQGRTNKFSSFLKTSLLKCPTSLIPEIELCKLQEIALKYEEYESMSMDLRRRTIVQTRKSLHDLYRYDERQKITNSLNIKIKKSESFDFHKTKSIQDSIDLDSSISAIRGVGPKLSERLSGLGLFLIRDLINYFPRDYVDYTALRTIDKTQVGQNVTIVAKIKRCNSFKSPKNKNLAILELFIKDKTGGMKVTRFLAGRRSSSIAYIKSQQNLYKVGATVAVSGLVKESRYGKSINDPLIEIIDSPNSYLKSRTIGQILPVYSLTDGITADKFRDLIQSILFLTSDIKDSIPSELLDRLNLP